jgi:hypothetical protein
LKILEKSFKKSKNLTVGSRGIAVVAGIAVGVGRTGTVAVAAVVGRFEVVDTAVLDTGLVAGIAGTAGFAVRNHKSHQTEP